MKLTVSAAALGLLALTLAGCGSAMRDMLERDTPQQQAAVRQDLTMPPDLRLPPPGSGPAEPASVTPGVYDSTSGTAAAVAPSAPRPTAEQGIYEKVGISIYKPDGSKKTDSELREELRQYYIAQKKQKNSNYGTVFNMGNIFSDE
jgi:hypothetical protein